MPDPRTSATVATEIQHLGLQLCQARLNYLEQERQLSDAIKRLVAERDGLQLREEVAAYKAAANPSKDTTDHVAADQQADPQPHAEST